MYKIEHYNGSRLIETIYKPNIQLAKWYVKYNKIMGNYKISKV